MSEPLSSHEIEDVLSSIRRLVSEELRPVTRAEEVVPVAAPVAARDDSKLLLTPSLRVVGESRTMATPAPRAVEAAAPPAAEVYDDDGLDLGDNGLGALRVAAMQDPAGDEVWAAPGAPVDEAQDWPADSLEETLPGTDWLQAEPEWIDEEPVPFTAHPRRADVPPAMTEEPLARAWAERAEAEVHATLRESGPKIIRPDAVSDTAEITIEEELEAEAAAASGIFDQDEPVFDEEMLRDLVREIIREELAGTLGERITRNVRKLVRMEVNRALTAREFG
ncbi:hypothetical protein [Neotabrizicola sp. VNH66]|uniref:hypothetical protein n=1 Tax=Neotabrizicola sp. VNH66 TaxID=3400918 RepID=UPI003C0F9490